MAKRATLVVGTKQSRWADKAGGLTRQTGRQADKADRQTGGQGRQADKADRLTRQNGQSIIVPTFKCQYFCYRH